MIISGGTLDATGFPQKVGGLAVGSLGTLDLTIGTVLSSTGADSLGGTLNLYGSLTGGTDELMAYASRTGTFANLSLNGLAWSGTLDYASNGLYLIVGTNTSVLGASTNSVSLGRVMLNHIPSANVIIGLTGGTSATGFSAATSGGATASASGNGPGAVTPSTSGTVTIGLANATGSYSGTVQVQNSGDDGLGDGPNNADAGQGNAQSPISISVTGTVVANRLVTASPANVGRQMAGATVPDAAGTTTLTSTGADDLFTRVTVGGTLFNGTTTSGTTAASGTVLGVAASGYLTTLTTSGEGLAGESPINVTVDYTATPLANRVVTSTSASLGLIHLGQTVAPQSLTLSTSGGDANFTRVTVGNAGPDANGLSVSGGANPTFNGLSVTDIRTISGTPNAAGVLYGTLMLPTNGEGLTGESPINVPVSYSVQVFSGSGIWTGGSGSSWASSGNWTDGNGSGIQAVPGTWGYNDTAAFNGSGSATAIDLTGVNPTLQALSFSNSSYSLSNGSLTLSSSGTATVTVSSGTQSINTPITLAAGSAAFAINGGALLLNSTISGSGGFTKTGSGGLTLPGADTLVATGPIAVAQGTLAAPLGIPHGGGGITLASGATLQAAGLVNRALTGAGTVTATGDLFIGKSTQPGQFNQGGGPGVGGTLNVGSNAVLLVSSDAVILGSQTNLGNGGSLTTLNGATRQRHVARRLEGPDGHGQRHHQRRLCQQRRRQRADRRGAIAHLHAIRGWGRDHNGKYRVCRRLQFWQRPCGRHGRERAPRP